MPCFPVQLTLALGFGITVSLQGAVTGQWDFGGDLSATVGAPLGYRGNTESATVFTTMTIGGEPAEVMQFPATSPAQGYIMAHGIAPNGAGTYVNQYTLIMDVMFPAFSASQWRALLQTSESNANDAELFVIPAGGIGISGSYQGSIAADTWHRVAFAFDLTLETGRLRKYIDGAMVGTQPLSSGTDGRWALAPTALIFSDDDQETALGYVNSLQIHDLALPDSDIIRLGGPTAGGIPAVPEPAAARLLGAGLLLLLARRYHGLGQPGMGG